MLVSSLGWSQQTALDSQKAMEVKKGVMRSAQATRTIVADFVQAKHLSFLSKDIISKGNLIFKDPNLIKWSYSTPFVYSVIFKENNLLINDAGKKSNIDLSSTKMFKQLNTLIAKSIKGDMFDEQKFDIQYFKTKNNYVVTFTSKEEAMHSFIKKFELTFDGKTYQVMKIKMIESPEDYTLITFTSLLVNKDVNDEVFTH
ncbi:MAG: outer membrane lipoprotein carrier protein LolA [Flavobacteriaceae bacterium]|nr:outer membrane lipoprotein carrier protein LolA [Flavobacteriaceae bacterium]